MTDPAACLAEEDDLECAKTAGHSGPHQARGPTGQVLAEWFDPAGPVNEETGALELAVSVAVNEFLSTGFALAHASFALPPGKAHEEWIGHAALDQAQFLYLSGADVKLVSKIMRLLVNGVAPNAGPVPICVICDDEPPHDRVIEAVDPDGNVSMTWKDNGHFWQKQRHGRYDGDYLWRDIIAEAVDYGWTLQHVAAETEDGVK